MEYVRIILGRDLRSLFVPGGGKRGMKMRLATVAGVILYLGLALAVGYGALKLFRYVEASLAFLPPFRMAVEVNILNGVTLFVLMMVFLTGMQVTYKTMYESDDIGFLMAQPVPVRSIFTAKFITSYSSLAAIAAAFGLPAWVGYGFAVRAGLRFYLVATSSLAMLLLTAHSAVSLLLLVAMRHLPGRKMKQLFIGASAIFGVLVVLVTQILSSRLQRTDDPSKMLEMIGKGQLAATWYLPSTWMVNSALGLIPEFGLSSVPNALALLVLAAALSLASVKASGSHFMAGWAGRTEETGAGRKRRRPERVAARRSLFPRSGYWTILRKDLRLLFRDPLVWYNLAVGVILIGFFIFNVTEMPTRTSRTEEEGAVMLGSVMLLMPVMMGSVTGAQTGGVSISREGPCFWLVRQSPVAATDLFRAKMTYALLPPAALFILSTAGVEMAGAPHYPLGLALLLGGSMVVAVASVQILLDVFFPDFTLKVEFGSAKSGRGTGKLLTTMFASVGLVILLTFILTLPATPLPKMLLPGAPAGTVTSATRYAVVAAGVLAAASARFFGVRQIERILADM